ncbi:MAG: hypothetical protein JXA98_07300 [Methanosarcinaceae archaeon]|nr:hypothetical protein [Methanosarcinaceae archaeon]
MSNETNTPLLSYRGKQLDHFDLAASKVIANVTKEKLSEILVAIYDVGLKKNQVFFQHDDCNHLCSNYRDYQNLLYQIGFLDKISRGKYILTPDGENVARGEPFCKHFLQSLLRLVKEKKEDDRHALLLLWFYHQASVMAGEHPRTEHFRKKSDKRDSAYPAIRKEVAKTMTKLVQSCFEQAFFEE